MKRIRKVFSVTNTMILAGIALTLLGIGSLVYKYIQDNSVVVLANGGTGESGGDPNAFRPPLQELAAADLTPTPASQVETVQTVAIATPQPTGKIPDRLLIPAIQLDAPVLQEHYKVITLDGREYVQWRVPFRFAAGWQDSTALPGEVGNTVLNGHHNEYGKVFKDLINLKEGDLIELYAGETIYTYKVTTIMLLPEKYQSMEVRIKNASWIMPTTDERLTLVTCWPPESNTHRLIVVAFPLKG